jgi:predicted TIM-barrel enzyme
VLIGYLGIGLTAKSAEAGGIDLLVLYNSGRYRMGGRGSLAGLMPYGNANSVVLEMASEVLPVVKNTPVLAGVCASDPFRSIPKFLGELKDLGFAGVQNFPTVGLIDGVFRMNLEETGMSYGLEVDMVAEARKMDLITTPYAFNGEESVRMARAGADIIVGMSRLVHCGSIFGGYVLTYSSTYGPDNIRYNRRPNKPDARRVCQRSARDKGCCGWRQRRRSRAMSRWSDCDARGC